MIILLSYTIYDYIKIKYNEDTKDLKIGDFIVFKSDEKCMEYGKILAIFPDKKWFEKIKSFREGVFLRVANPRDMQIINLSDELQKKYLSIAKDLAKKNNIEMKFIKVSLSADQTKLFFLFSAEERIDFRELVKQIATATSKSIRLHQIGPRDHARILGGFGICGRQQCCNTCLNHMELPSISLEMIKIQNLEARGPKKLSGNCGKLLCCLAYEMYMYNNTESVTDKINSDTNSN